MAAGDGFRQVPFGFDKNEVNSYISDLRKKMSTLEADVSKYEEQTQAAEKLAAEADGRIKEAVEAADRKVSEINAKLEEEKDINYRHEMEINHLKERIDAEKKKMTDLLKSGKGVSEEATRAFNEVIEKANDEAADIIAKAEKRAEDIIGEAERKHNAINDRIASFLEHFRGQLEAMNNGYASVSSLAEELLGATSAEAVTLPAAEPTPVYYAPEPETAEQPDMSVFDSVEEEADMPADTSAEESAELIPEPVTLPITAEEGSPARLDTPIEYAEAEDKAEDKQPAEEAQADIPLMNPESSGNMFADGLFDSDSDDNISGFDMEAAEQSVSQIDPLDVSEHSEPMFNSDFTADLLSQTMTSSSLGDDADEDLLAAVRATEEAAAIKPSDMDDISMDDEGDSSGLSDEDDLMKALLDAEAALQGMNSAELSTEEEAAEEAAADPWADLQKQLEAMESSAADEPVVILAAKEQPEPEKYTAPPSADDSSIWDFGGSENSDDDMSPDFGGFGGFGGF